jgi:hypothetical protein
MILNSSQIHFGRGCKFRHLFHSSMCIKPLLQEVIFYLYLKLGFFISKYQYLFFFYFSSFNIRGNQSEDREGKGGGTGGQRTSK